MFDADDLYNMGQKMMENIRQEAMIGTVDSLIMAAEERDLQAVTVDELKYTRSVLAGEEDLTLAEKIGDDTAMRMFDALYAN